LVNAGGAKRGVVPSVPSWRREIFHCERVPNKMRQRDRGPRGRSAVPEPSRRVRGALRSAFGVTRPEMGGGYISCGDFEGEDKSASAFFGVLAAIRPALESLNAAHVNSFVQQVAKVETGHADPPVVIPPRVAAVVLPRLSVLRDELVARLGTSDRYAALDAAPEGKWGEGPAWELHCIEDLIPAWEHAIEEQQDIVIDFD